jgi:hypothetical protein
MFRNLAAKTCLFRPKCWLVAAAAAAALAASSGASAASAASAASVSASAPSARPRRASWWSGSRGGSTRPRPTWHSPGCSPRSPGSSRSRATTKLHRLEENIGAVEIELVAEDLREIEEAGLSAEGARHAEAQQR